MPLEPTEARELRRLGERTRKARAAAEAAHAELVRGLAASRNKATVRELAEATGLSHQRVQQLLSKPA